MESSMLNRSFSKRYPYAIGARGIYITLEDGRKILDGCCGAAVSCLGYQHPRVIKAMKEQINGLPWVHTSFYTHHAQEDLAKFLIAQGSGAFHKAGHYSSGSEAVETALKLARQYQISKGQPDRTIFLSRIDSYHGNTLGALSAGYNRPRREPFKEMCSPAFHHIDRCFYNKDAVEGESETEYVDRLLKSYEDVIARLAPSKIAALILEPVTGATIGTVVPPAGYLNRVRELCDRIGALLIYDEVMCGMGRTGSYHAWEGLDGVSCAPDLQAIGKGLAAGYQPLSAVLINEKVYKTVSTPGGLPFTNGHTYQGHAMACGTALAVQNIIVEDDLLSNVRRQGERLVQGLRSALDPKVVSEIRGRGLFQTVELENQGKKIAATVAELCFQKGLAVYLVSGGIDGILFAPPFIITDSEVDALVSIFSSAVEEACR